MDLLTLNCTPGQVSILSISQTGSEGRGSALEQGGGAEEFLRVDAEQNPVLLSTRCAWFLADPADFILLGGRSGWSLHRLKQQSLCGWVRHEPPVHAVAVFTMEGKRHRTFDGGASWSDEDLLPAIQAAWAGGPFRSLVLTAVAADARNLAVVVSSHDWRLPSGKQLLESAVLSSTDDGQSFSTRALMHGSEARLRGLVFA